MNDKRDIAQFASMLLLIVFGLLSAERGLAAEPVFRIHFVDVGKGNAFLLEFPCGFIMFDAGGAEGTTQQLTDYIDKVMMTRPAGERKIDLVILSHGHLDHTTNISAVLAHYPVDEVMTNGHFGKRGLKQMPDLFAQYPDTVSYVADTQNIPPGGLHLPVSERLGCAGQIAPDLRLLWGDARPQLPGWSDKEYADENNHSVALLVQWGKTKTLFTGDMERTALQAMLDQDRDLLANIDLDQISHHGFSSGSLPTFDAYIDPRVAVLSRDANSPWYEPTMKEWDGLVRERRAPVEVPVWTMPDTKSGADESLNELDSGDSSPQPAQKPVLKGSQKPALKAGRIPGTAILSGGIYWTGRDGTVVVELSPDGGLKVTTAH